MKHTPKGLEFKAFRGGKKGDFFMKKRQWTGSQKLQIVLDGLSGKYSISELCTKYELNQTQYYKWRDQLLKQGPMFLMKNQTKRTLIWKGK